MLGSNQNQPINSPRIIFNELGMVEIEKCPRCDSRRFNTIDYNNWFHCWACRLVCKVSELKGVKIC